MLQGQNVKALEKPYGFPSAFLLHIYDNSIIEHFTFEKVYMLYAVQVCGAPQLGVNSAEMTSFGRMTTLKRTAFQSCTALEEITTDCVT